MSDFNEEGSRFQVSDPRKTNHSRYANIMMDTAFKRVFGTEASKNELLELLRCLIPDRPIRSVSLRNTENIPKFKGDKKTCFDIFCDGDNGEKFIVEMQLVRQRNFLNRSLYYSTYPIQEQLIKEEKDMQKRLKEELEGGRRQSHDEVFRIRPVYMIGILNFSLEGEDEKDLREGLVSSYSLRNDLSGKAMSDKLNFLFLQIPRMKYGPDEAHRCRTMLERLVFSFKHISCLQEQPDEFGEDFFTNVYAQAEISGMDKDEYDNYLKDMRTELDTLAQINTAWNDGETNGKTKEKREIAQRMLGKGFPAEEISELTGLPAEEVEKLKQGHLSPKSL